VAVLGIATAGCLIPGTTGDETSGGESTTGAPAGDGEITIATFNVRRLFDTVCDSGQCGAGAFEVVPSQAAFDAQVEELARGISLLDADVVLLQEIENQAALDALVQALDGRYPSAVIGETDFAASVDVAILSAIPIDYVGRHAEEPIPLPGGGTTWFTRELLEVQFEVDGVRVAIFDAHFKSKNDDDPQRRLAEAMAAEAVVTARAEELSGGLVIFGGDLNDTPGSPPLEALEADMSLHRVASDLDSDATYEWNGTPQALDHLYVSLAASGGSYTPNSAEVLGEPGEGWAGSDHSALRATFELDGG
jgi:predicted extracellular nuclease